MEGVEKVESEKVHSQRRSKGKGEAIEAEEEENVKELIVVVTGGSNRKEER